MRFGSEELMAMLFTTTFWSSVAVQLSPSSLLLKRPPGITGA
jgi:hypothetical protein